MSSNILQQNQTKNLYDILTSLSYDILTPLFKMEKNGKNDILIIHSKELKHSTRKSDSKNLYETKTSLSYDILTPP